MKNILLTLLLLCLNVTGAVAQNVLVNEIMACNVDAVLDPSYNYGPWIELYNPGNTPFSLDGLYLTDDASDLRKFRLNEPQDQRTVPARGFKVIYFDHHDLYAPWQVSFKLSDTGGTIMLTDGTDILLTQDYPQAVGRTSYARRTNGGSLWAYTSTPTPGATNVGSKFASTQLPAPSFSVDTPFVADGQQVAIVCEQSAATIRYTLDGTTPTLDNGTPYTAPVTLQGNTVIRARAFRTGYLPSEVATRTYLTDATAYPFPLVCIATDPDNLYDRERGLFQSSWWGPGRPGNGQSADCNWNMDWDRPVNFEYITPGGEYALSQEVDFSMCGGWSRAWTPHSFKLKAAKHYMGRNTLDYDFFPDSKPALRHRVLQIRNGGNDTRYRIKDAALQELVRRSGFNLDTQAWQPVHVFLNGSYYAVLNMREPNNKRYAQTNYGYDDDQLDLFEMGPDSGYTQMVGTPDKYLEWYELSARAADPVVYQQICNLVDIDEYINYMAVELYLNNTDWPQNNVKGFRSTPDGRFRFVLFDLDFAFGNDGSGAESASPNPFATFANKRNYTFNELYGKQGDWQYDEESGEWGPTWITPWHTGDRIREEIQFVTIFLQMLQNETFRRRFIDTFTIVGGSIFEPSRVKDIVTDMRDYLNQGMSLTGESCATSASKVITTLTTTRHTNMMNTLKRYAPMELAGVRAATLNLSSYVLDSTGRQVAFDQGAILLNGLEVPTGRLKGKAYYPITLQALAPAGYEFAGWTDLTGKTLKCAATEYEVPAGTNTLSVRATWRPMTPDEFTARGIAPAPVVVNEVSAENDIYVSEYFKKSDWIELYNTTDRDIDLAGLYLTDNPDNPHKYQIPTADPTLNTVLPAHGYKQIWCDKQASASPAIHANFKLAKEGGTVMLSSYADDGRLLYRDSLTYTAHTAQQTFGRYPDGGTRTYTMQRPSYLSRNTLTPSSLIHPTGIRGDIDNDALLTRADLRLLLRAYLSGQAIPSERLPQYDLNADGQFNISDITSLLSFFR